MKKQLFVATAVGLVSSLALAGCSSSDSGTAEGGAAANGGGIVTYRTCEPQAGMIPGMITEACGVHLLGQVAATLVTYDSKGELVNDLAESINSDDKQTWTVKVKAGRKFSDGTPITAKSFVDAWNLIVREKQPQAYFFDDVEGYEEGKDLPGLKVVDDNTFTVTLNQPESDWPIRLGHVTFVPLPEVALKDIKAFGEKPVSSGPYVLDNWEHRKQLNLSVNPNYDGPRKAQNGGLNGVMYTSTDAAYNDLMADHLDVSDIIPESALQGFKDELNGRAVSKPYAGIATFTIPNRLKHFEGEEGKLRRKAISLAINREEITKVIFNGTKAPARDFTAPSIAGWNDKLPGSENLNFNPEKAKELWAQADAISKWDGTFKIAYNSDSGHQAWVDAVCNQVKNNLGIDAQGDAYPDLKSLREKVENKTIETAFRAGWSADYPSAYNFLGPLYGTGAFGNDSGYSNPEVDKLLKEALGAKTEDEAKAKYDEAQKILLADLPAIPLWYSSVNGGWSANVENVDFGWDSLPILFAVTKK
ncbi:ABC transporter substrate-binding protein [Boudabousia liubingyangii]|uniref:ABC transporter substrate-binding protein n=1 Tax=Boudabousia liubingyangii TaxID=1921764 RepID=A0A1Q5PMK6_9ACTO|nr:ABC transporter substrate-binding protein [Boudabousia liubingyangii]OKL48781.1 ABC transporter substrate-binding protein [Boudabousia liubingyangii]